MHKVRTLNSISVKGLDQFSRENYELASELVNPDAIILRSYKLGSDDIVDSVKAIARAGAGVNNIPVSDCTDRGIPVFNTPGANANAVKELVMAALLLGSRGIVEGMNYSQSLGEINDYAEMNKILEAEKKRFKGEELVGKKLGVVGLGAIGSSVAQMGLTLGMEVLGYDPALSVAAAWRLPSEVQSMDNLVSLFSKADYISLHLPVLDSTRNLVNADLLKQVKPGAKLLNFARAEIVDNEAVLESIAAGGLARYLSDFPAPELIGKDGVYLMPHIGASTNEAEENCAIMAAAQLKDFLENGNIKNSVNFPALYLERTQGCRVAIANRNIPAMLGSILAVFADHNLNVDDMLNKSRDEIAYTLIDLDEAPSDEALAALNAVEGVINVRVLPCK